jgi:deoxyribodipyrimidine photolyase-related protein
MARHESLLSQNPRLGLTYRQLHNMDEEQQQVLQQSARIFLKSLDQTD